MRSKLYYQSAASQDTVAINLISASHWEKTSAALKDNERNQLANQQFKAKPGDLGVIANSQGIISQVYLGIGNDNYALALANAANKLPPGSYRLKQAVPESALLNWALAQYRYDHYKKNDSQPRVLVLKEKEQQQIESQVEAVFLVRDLINAPTNAMGPEQLAAAAKTLAGQYDAQYEQWVGDELLTANYPAIHAVGRASASAPRLIKMTWGEKKHPIVTLVGKGVCFDSGGLDIKPSSAMRLMKKDMGGAAHALGLASWIMANKLPVRLEVLIPAVENAVGPDAFRPGDILTMRNGMTVEIDNTDAEGRLVLADAITKAAESKPDLIIDFATLTGAARIAVGTEIAALFTNDEKLAEKLAKSAHECDDPIWRLPLFAGYDSMLDSPIADMVNSSASSYAGAITAALFLKRFVPVDTSWAHFDIMAWNVSSKPGKPEGGEAMAIRAIARYLQKTYSI
ncbi:leucyl aminopeptidase family protein [Legionella dresdenensis]|uniref:Leucyl aminopeptidase family protein n=1 Tax=Legionella dresdenensis TaxID=450200 RepID=A0ABV8CFX0_9GAMM